MMRSMRLQPAMIAVLAVAVFPPAVSGADSTPATSNAARRDPQNPADPPVTSLGEVVIQGKPMSDTEQRRFSTAAKMVFGREELDRYGDSSLGDVLKRLPGVTLSGTPGRGGDIRMRGLGNGYTQILINGEPVPRGFSMDSISPDQIERIEVMRAPVAEHSARAIAGTINIVLREDFTRRETQFRPTLGWENSRVQPSISLQRSDVLGSFSYNLSATASLRDLASDSRIDTRATDLMSGAPVLLQSETDAVFSRSDALFMTSRLGWRLNDGDRLFIQPFVNVSRSNGWGDAILDQAFGVVDPPFAHAAWKTNNDRSMVRVISNWQHRIDAASRLELRLSGNYADATSVSARSQYDGVGNLAHVLDSTSKVDDRGLNTSGKYSRRLEQGHSLAVGWEAELGNRHEGGTSVQDGVVQLAEFGNSVHAQTRRLAAYAQNEWGVTPLWSMYAGLRWEGIRTHTAWSDNAVDSSSCVASPLLHSVWRLSEESKDQVRLGLTRSYKSPTSANLVPRPTLASAYPTSGPNTATSADSAGNPSLKPELAWGLDLSVEHYLAEGGLFSVSAFLRNIDDLIRNVTSLQSVSWAAVPRWVSSPINIGRARTRGIELEAKLKLSELVIGAPPLDLRANLSRYWSRVEDVPGPNNRLDQQPSATANVGVDYRFRAVPLTLGGNLNWMPAFTVRQSDVQTYSQGIKRVLDVYALWRFDPKTQLRVSASNILQADYETANGHRLESTEQVAQSIASSYISFAARLEMRF